MMQVARIIIDATHMLSAKVRYLVHLPSCRDHNPQPAHEQAAVLSRQGKIQYSQTQFTDALSCTDAAG
jgi:hypothetical protein